MWNGSLRPGQALAPSRRGGSRGGAFARAAGGGRVAAVVLAGLGAEVDFFCALGREAEGAEAAAQLSERGVRVHAARREDRTRRAFTLLDDGNERTIVTIGQRLQPLGADELDWDCLRGADGVFFTAGDSGALQRARTATVVVASPRGRAAFQQPGASVDALVFSSRDRDEREWASRIGNRSRLWVATEGAKGGR